MLHVTWSICIPMMGRMSVAFVHLLVPEEEDSSLLAVVYVTLKDNIFGLNV